MDRSALIVIDLANDFVYKGGVIADAGGAAYQERAQAMLPGLARLIEAARAAGITIIYATDSHSLEDSELLKWPPHSMKGTWNAQIVPAVAPQEGDVVLEKNTYSPFASTNLEDILRERGITRLYVTGLHTDCCARHTSGDAFQKGFDMVWVTDALDAFTREAHLAGLEYFKAWYAIDAERQLRTSADLIAEWALEAVAAD